MIIKKHYQPKVVHEEAVHCQDECYSYLIRIKDLDFWVDVFTDRSDDLQVEWNQYIFFLKDAEDFKRREMQDDIENFNFVYDLITADLPQDYGRGLQKQ